MKKSLGVLVGVFVAALVVGGAANSALAQDKAKVAKGQAGKPAMKVLAENDKAQAFEIRYKPGDQNTSVPTSNVRVVRALKGGTLLRTYADGKTENSVWKTGEVRIIAPSGQYTTKNVGKGEVALYVVVLK